MFLHKPRDRLIDSCTAGSIPESLVLQFSVVYDRDIFQFDTKSVAVLAFMPYLLPVDLQMVRQLGG